MLTPHPENKEPHRGIGRRKRRKSKAFPYLETTLHIRVYSLLQTRHTLVFPGIKTSQISYVTKAHYTFCHFVAFSLWRFCFGQSSAELRSDTLIAGKVHSMARTGQRGVEGYVPSGQVYGCTFTLRRRSEI